VPPYDVLTFHCVATLRLHKGQITLQGLIDVQGEDDSGPFTVAITAGTGAFRGAGGEAVIRDVSDTTTLYKLRFDSAKKKRHHRQTSPWRWRQAAGTPVFAACRSDQARRLPDDPRAARRQPSDAVSTG
jgi:allene oxide cyclase-like protein